MAKIQKPVHYLVESSRIVDIKLCRIIVFGFFFHVAAYTCTAASGDLGNADLNSFASHRLGFSRGHDDTGIRYCDPQDRNDPLENFIRHAVVKGIRIDIIRRTHTRYTDGVRSASERVFKMLCMHKDAYEIVFIKIEAEQNAAAYIVNPRFHRPVHGLGMIRIIALRTGWVKIFIRFFIICLLEQDVRSDPGVFQLLIILDRRGRDVNVDTADRSVFMFDAVDRIDAFQYVFDRVVFRIFSRLDGQPFVSHILQSRDFLTDLLLRQLLSADMLVLSMIRAVFASIDAVIRKIQRREQHDPVAIKFFFDFLRQSENFLMDAFILTFQKQRRFPVGKTFAVLRPLQDLSHILDIIFMFLCIAQSFLDFFVADEFLRLL